MVRWGGRQRAFYLPHNVGRPAENVAMTSAITIIKQAFSQTDNVKVPPGSFFFSFFASSPPLSQLHVKCKEASGLKKTS